MESGIRTSVIAVLCDDLESLETLLNHLNAIRRRESSNFLSRTVTAEQIIPVLIDLVEDGFAETALYNASCKMLESVNAEEYPVRSHADALWFRLTHKGRLICEEMAS